ncbi:CHAD domain-containing protein [Fulvivirga ligni]|uniref:CHAD domain-containing protein n=1 Tax=Fulvivirga ligni TaxID=2904246 RepID=UPI001F2E0101|nr:CHAD domain-containing protein [Fulvivirga ligni]UII19958.1 CHAD domain-containing protein [Fulvivirga ligni]
MSISILDNESFRQGANRIINEELTIAFDTLENCSQDGRHEAIHTVRKSFKKIRAILRLIRDNIGKEIYKAENHFYRDLARSVSKLRDHTSIIEMLHLLKQQYNPELEDDTFNTPLNSLEYYRRQATKKELDQEDKLSILRESLHEKLKDDREWIPKIKSFKDISPNLRRVYKRGKEAMEKADENGRPEDFHQWRKRVKYLRYQLELIEKIWPRTIKSFRKELSDISDYLGSDRDLYILTETLQTSSVKFKNDAEKGILLALILQQRQQMQQMALLKGHHFYQFKCDEIITLLENSWKYHKKQMKQDSLKEEILIKG